MEIIQITPEILKDKEAFRRLVILQATPALVKEHCNTFAAAQIACSYANSVIKELYKDIE